MFDRYAVYYTPQGPLATCGAAWLGWDLQTGTQVPQPEFDRFDIAEITATPRKYGMHGTIKPPFYLADGCTADRLQQALGGLCSGLKPVRLGGLAVRPLGGFLALTPQGDQAALAGLAAQVVTTLDGFRAPPSKAELARRRQSPLTREQERHLANWGYPYVMDQFRFHITLTGRLDPVDLAEITQVAEAYFDGSLPAPFVVESLTLVGQDRDGMFRQIQRYALTG